MFNKHEKKCERDTVVLARLGRIFPEDIFLIEKKSGMPQKFKVPKPIIPSIKFKKGGIVK